MKKMLLLQIFYFSGRGSKILQEKIGEAMKNQHEENLVHRSS